ncbi:MAG: tetratricopeptide repeat protein [Bacteroidales bacterium]|nr:tetratricopeptide repeat protein [Bacteroidales bacterium]
MKSNRYKEALACYDEVLMLADKTGNILLKARCLERMASLHLSMNDPNLSLKLYYQALPLFESVNNKQGIASVYNILGIYKTDQNEFDTAFSYFKKAMSLNSEVNNEYGLLQNRGNLAYLYEKQGKMRDAEKIYLELIGGLEKENEKISLPILYDNLASLLHQSKRNEESLEFLRKGIRIAEDTRDTSMLESLYHNTGGLYYSMKKPDSAAYYLKRSVICARAVGAVKSEMKALSLLMATDTASGNYKAAAEKSNRMVILKDSVYSRKIRNNLRNSELGYENDKKEKLIAYQQLEIKITRQKQTWFLILFLISTLSLLLLVALIVVLRKNSLRKHEILQERLKISALELGKVRSDEEIHRLRLEKIQEEVRTKKREQLSNALAIEQKNELLNQISEKISTAMGDADSIKADLLQQIVSSIKTQVRNSGEVDHFNEKFSSLHQEFYANLKSRHPDLTKTELKFCAYLKINLSGNQIANILNVTNEAIRKTRYRIRKKMDLSSDESLEHYISTF